MTNTYFYCRYSPKPDAADVQSLKVQEDACESYRRHAGLPPLAPVELETDDFDILAAGRRGVLADPLTSARKKPLDSRPQGKHLRKLLKPGDHLVVYRLDRLFRSSTDGERHLIRWDKLGVQLHLAAEGGCSITTKSATGRFLMRILLAATAFEPELTSERTRGSMNRQQQSAEWGAGSGRLMSLIPPYGKTEGPIVFIDGKKVKTLVDDPGEQAQIRRIVEWHRQRVPYAEIARRLIEEAVPNKGQQYGKKGSWNATSIKRILRRAMQPQR